MPLLYINADDFGLHRDIDRGIVACVDAGRLTGLSLSPNGSSIDWSLAKELSARVDVGVHVTLVGETWLSAKRHFANWTSLVPWLLFPGKAASLEREIRQQIESLLSADIRPTHLDSHQHVHVMSPIWSICRRLANEYAIPRIRVPAAPSQSASKSSLAGRILQKMSCRREIEMPRALRCIGIASAGHNTTQTLVDELKSAAQRDLELVAHPGFDTPELQARYAAWKFDWTSERGAILNDEFARAVEAAGYRIGRASGG